MKNSKTLVFIALTPFTFLVFFFASWVSFSALATLSDDPFTYGTWPDIVAAGSLQTAVSLIIGEIISDFAYELYWIAIPSHAFRRLCPPHQFLEGRLLRKRVCQRRPDLDTVVSATTGYNNTRKYS